MPSNKIRHTRKLKRSIDKSVYNPNQKFCRDCDQPINKNCYNSDILMGKCGRCYRMNIKENVRRALNKSKDKKRNNQRRFKYVSQNF